MTKIQFLLINTGALLTAFGGLFLKKISLKLFPLSKDSILITLLSPEFWVGGVCYLAPIFLWTYLLKSMELTKLQPLLSIVYIYTIIISYIFLHESISMTRFLGIALIMLGVIVVGRS